MCVVLAFVDGAGRACSRSSLLLGVGQAVNGATWQALLPSLVAGRPARAGARPVARRSNTVGRASTAPALGGLLTARAGARVPLLRRRGDVPRRDGRRRCWCGAARASSPARRRRARAGGLAIVRRASAAARDDRRCSALFVLLGSMVNVVEVFLVRETLHAGAVWYGLVGGGLRGRACCAARLSAGRLRQRRARAGAGSCAAGALLGAGLVGDGAGPGRRLAAGVRDGHRRLQRRAQRLHGALVWAGGAGRARTGRRAAHAASRRGRSWAPTRRAERWRRCSRRGRSSSRPECWRCSGRCCSAARWCGRRGRARKSSGRSRRPWARGERGRARAGTRRRASGRLLAALALGASRGTSVG